MSTLRQRKGRPSPKTALKDMSDSDSPETVEIPSSTTKGGKSEVPKSKVRKFLERFIATWTMIGAFAVVLYIGHPAVICVMLTFQVMAFREISILGTKDRIEKELPNMYQLHWGIMFAFAFHLNGAMLFDNVLIELRNGDGGEANPHLIDLVQHARQWHPFASFSMMCAILVSFVLSLKPDYYRYQFKQLGWCLLTVMMAICFSSCVIWNVSDGLIWMLVPALLIMTNDIMAYMFGMSFGKTPLIELSPNKTWEGAIGGGISTIFMALIVSDYFIRNEFFVCPKLGISMEYPTCTVAPVFLKTEKKVPPELASYLISMGVSEYWLSGWMFADFQLHSMVFALFAAVIGPFGGFFASGFKRAFKIKDFADTIPGHGGITDRMDCQVLMAAFVYFYRKAFIKGAAQLWDQVLLLGRDDQLELYQELQNHLGIQ